ncbi:MAG: hypothetical protein K1X57_13185 [Gemmataceae bacterium]|nr:hypothetical protein [Gemmataceae bacterium]
MCTFYLLPERNEVARRFSSYLQSWFPGVRPAMDELPDRLASTVDPRSVVIFADELPTMRGSDLPTVLSEDFGARPHDRVIDLRNGPSGEAAADAWVIPMPQPTHLRKVC